MWICPKHGPSCPNEKIVTRRVRDPHAPGGWRYPTNAKVFVFCVPPKIGGAVAAVAARPKRLREPRGRPLAKRTVARKS